ncbi:hypothetical protein WM40_06920 [Robbsia andropogonis]|uniref:Uncharacterized protein n=1 Tax=Robbsia andropogonis TaxID=28092 RepID=A0A0F5K274_9BURK|nr:type III secretion system chaperone [Robbsia andropogonis]KKB64221.1 hypothetical protein WM40_06920 [Robbsia andropogonis]MCP1118786.1 type III secretion system chaperone [Robbsia andropogonis]MCP1128253.1 type III secretion system chaperone [Robbsia andropogonis]
MSLDPKYVGALKALALEIGADAEALTACQTLVVGNVILTFSPTEDAGATTIQCACKIGPLPPEPSIDLLRLLLQANTLGPATAGATFALQLGADELVLEQRHSVDTPPAMLARACRNQAEAALAWAPALTHGTQRVSRSSAANLYDMLSGIQS